MSTTTPLRPHEADDDLGGRWGWKTLSRRTRTVVAVAVVVVLAVAAAWLVAFSSVFAVRSVDVRGVHNLTAAEVRARAQIADGTPLLRVDTVAVTARIDQLPDVASAEVSTSYPSTVVITVVERSPVGYLKAAGSDTLVDRTGAAYRVVASAPSTLPELVVSAKHTCCGGAGCRSTSSSPAGRRDVDPGTGPGRDHPRAHGRSRRALGERRTQRGQGADPAGAATQGRPAVRRDQPGSAVLAVRFIGRRRANRRVARRACEGSSGWRSNFGTSTTG